MTPRPSPLHHPDRAAPVQRPVLVLLHGHGEEPDAFAAHGRRLVDVDAWTIVCPEAPHELPEGGRAWWTVDEDAPTEATLSAVMASIPPETGTVYITGFSQGEAVALRLGQRCSEARPHARCSLAVVSAFLPGDAVALPAGTAILVVHGTKDEVVDPFHSELVARRLRRQDCNVTQVHHDGGHVWDDSVADTVRAWLHPQQ